MHFSIQGIFKEFSVVFICVIALVGSYMITPGNYAYKLENGDFNTEEESQKVLGISTQSPDFLCPIHKPIIGWIDYRGRKLIVDNLSDKTEPSACFESVERAQEEGFFYKK